MDSVLTIFHTENCSTVPFLSYHFPLSDVAAHGCTAVYILLKITSLPCEKIWGKEGGHRHGSKISKA